ncbi:MAG: ATP-binding protein [Butyrivibrio sp.]|nr:ATP-binding protein [Butyrivibrio sp.]
MEANSTRTVSKLFFRLLPVQIVLSAIGSINGIVSSLFASNAVGVEAVSAIGLFSPFNMVITTLAGVFAVGSQMVCATYMGKNELENTQRVFSLDITISVVSSLVLSAFMVIFVALSGARFLTGDETVIRYFNQYMLGQTLGVLPLMLGQQCATFLSLENMMRRITVASIVYIIFNVIFNFVFLRVLKMEALGLAIAASIGMWIYFGIQAEHFLSGRSVYKLKLVKGMFKELKDVLKIGSHGALVNIYMIIRAGIVNGLMVKYAGSVGVSAFTAANTLLGFFWAIPAGMVSVSRMLMSVYTGEQDRESLKANMKTALYKCVPIMTLVAVFIIIFGDFFTRIYFNDPSSEVYRLTLWGYRILPFAMPLSVICNHFVCYGQTSDKEVLINVVSIFDGAISVSLFSFLLTPVIGLSGVYIANVINGLVSIVIILIYSVFKNKKFPTNLDELMVIPEDFGASKEDRIDVAITRMEEVINISEKITDFCLEKGVDTRRANLAGLFMEEMSGNVVDHGFTKDNKDHTIDIRVVYKDGKLVLRIKDDCIPFDPKSRSSIMDPDDITKNIGIRMVYKLAEKIEYQNILGLNVLTISV